MQIKFRVLSVVALLVVSACQEKEKEQESSTYRLKTGNYRAVLKVMDDKELPFLFTVFSTDSLAVFNADETIIVQDIVYRNDSVYINMPAFEGFIEAKIHHDRLEGSFIKESLDRIVPFKAVKDDVELFKTIKQPSYNISGAWETVFSKGVAEDEYMAKGIFKQVGNKVTGTFVTATGDYRYLDGVLAGDSLKLSTFDGAHAFLFEALVTDTAMQGVFYSGNHWKEPFEGRRNDDFELPDADQFTKMRNANETIEFTFPDLDGQDISLSDPRFDNKVVIVQIMGSWCPNCLDETKYYTEYYNANKPENVEFVALAFEYAKTKEKAINGLHKLKGDAKIPYPILLAQFGSSDKEEAQKKMPMLDKILSYPTTIFIDKNRKVRKVHTGFNGPATGDKYLSFQRDFELFVAMLAQE